MADPHWTSYVGMVTGIFGAIMGFMSYLRSYSFKSLDLRLELRKSVKDIHQMYTQLNMLIINSNKSRCAVASAKGYFYSGKMELWAQQVEKDTDSLRKIKDKFPESEESFTSLSAENLESKLVEIHNIQGSLLTLIEKYTSEIESDNEARRHIRDTHGG